MSGLGAFDFSEVECQKWLGARSYFLTEVCGTHRKYATLQVFLEKITATSEDHWN